MLQTRLAAAAQSLQLHILNGQPFSVRVAAVFQKLAISDREMFSRFVAAHFLLRDVVDMKLAPLSDKVREVIDKNRLSKGATFNRAVNRLALLISGRYFREEADAIRRTAFKYAISVVKIPSQAIDGLFAEAVGKALVKLQAHPVKEGASRAEAAKYVRVILQNAIIDAFRSLIRQEQRETSLIDDEGQMRDIEVEIDDTEALEQAVLRLPGVERSKFMEALRTDARRTGVFKGDLSVLGELVNLAVEGHSQRQISQQLGLGLGTVNEFFKRWLPLANQTVDRYLES